MRSLKLLCLKASLFLFFIPSLVQAQGKAKTIQIENAKYLLGSNKRTGDARRLIGNVILFHDGARMYCDSAWFYSEQNTLIAYSNVKIVQEDSLEITSDYLNYSGKTKLAQLKGDVVLKDGEMTLYTEQLNYDRNLKRGFYNVGGRLIDPENNLYSKKGTYYSNTEKAYFKDSVVLINPEYTMYSDTLIYHAPSSQSTFVGSTRIVSEENVIICKEGWYNSLSNKSSFYKRAIFVSEGQNLVADSLHYDRNINYANAWGNVILKDTAEGIAMSGNRAKYDGILKLSKVWERPLLAIATENDSLFVHSDTFRIVEDTAENKEFFAYTGVRFYQSEMQGICDTLHFVSKDSMLYFLGDPVLWTSENQLSAVKMKARFVDGSIEELYLNKSCFLINLDTLSNYNQVKGLKMVGFFKDNELDKIKVNGNAQSLYFARDDLKELVGVDFAKASSLIIYIIDKEIGKVQYLDQIETELKPESELNPDKLILEDFKWRAAERPMDRQDIYRKAKPAPIKLEKDSISAPSDSSLIQIEIIKDKLQPKLD